jgi:lysozyme family protein
MQKNLPYALAFTLKYEGGFADDPHDPGGATNMGITLATYRADIDCKGSIAALRAMTVETAGIVYQKHYWAPISGDLLPSGLDVLLFDIAVNMGQGREMRIARATAHLSGLARITAVHNLRLGFWRRLAIWARFGKGWAARETACFALAKRLCGATP